MSASIPGRVLLIRAVFCPTPGMVRLLRLFPTVPLVPLTPLCSSMVSETAVFATPNFEVPSTLAPFCGSGMFPFSPSPRKVPRLWCRPRTHRFPFRRRVLSGGLHLCHQLHSFCLVFDRSGPTCVLIVDPTVDSVASALPDASSYRGPEI